MSPLADMTPEQIVGEGSQSWQRYFDGTTRLVRTTNLETHFPSGELIVSQTDTQGIITKCNEAFVRMSGYTEAELLGQPHSILRHPDMPAAAFADLWETVNAGKRWSGYVKNLRKDGGFYWVYATIIPKVRGGQIVGHTSVRREPSRVKVHEMEKVYAEMASKEARHA
ncbi:MAG: PAS domain-containing protein [Propionibacteriaceae bacterium]|nr:PAS domain-containing protein [Propionibacteriaceae bacterium]